MEQQQIGIEVLKNIIADQTIAIKILELQLRKVNSELSAFKAVDEQNKNEE